MLAGSWAVGMIGCLALGWILASIMLLLDRMGWVMVEGIAGLLFLVSGTVIPLSTLPSSLAFIGKLQPISYWAELWRIAIFGRSAALSLPGMALETMWSRLWIISVVWMIGAIIWHKAADRIVRRWGRIETETFY